MTSIERESAVIERMKLEAQLGMLQIENAKLRAEKEVLLNQLCDWLGALQIKNAELCADKELLLTQLCDCLQALIRSERRQHEPVGHLEPLPSRHAAWHHSGIHSAYRNSGEG